MKTMQQESNIPELKSVLIPSKEEECKKRNNFAHKSQKELKKMFDQLLVTGRCKC